MLVHMQFPGIILCDIMSCFPIDLRLFLFIYFSSIFLTCGYMYMYRNYLFMYTNVKLYLYIFYVYFKLHEQIQKISSGVGEGPDKVGPIAFQGVSVSMCF